MLPSKQELRKKWVEAMRSGEYQQTAGSLHNSKGYCCLGVACDVYAKAGGDLTMSEGNTDGGGTITYRYKGPDDDRSQSAVLPDSVKKAFGFVGDMGDYSDQYSKDMGGYTCLAWQNDDGSTFEQIADEVEKNGKYIFKE